MPPEHRLDEWHAFAMLSDSRQQGMAEGAIPLTEIEAYLRVFEIREPDEIEAFIYLIREMDREYLTVRREQSKQAQDDKRGQG